MEQQATGFATRSGRVVLTEDELRVEPGGNFVGRLQDNLWLARVGYALAFAACGALAADGLRKGHTFEGGFVGLLAAMFGWSALQAFQRSSVARIPRAAIRSVEAEEPKPPFAPAAFTVSYEVQGKAGKAVFVLPGPADGGEEAWRAGQEVLGEWI